MARTASTEEKKPNGEWNISAVLRNILKEQGLDVGIDVVRDKFKAKTGIDEVPPSLYAIKASLKKEGKGGTSGKKSASPGKKADKKVEANGVVEAASSVESANGVASNHHSNVVKAVTLTQEAMHLCGGKQELLNLIERLCPSS